MLAPSPRSGYFRYMDDVTQILSAIEQGDPQAAEQLLPLVYEELRKLAAHKLAQEKPGQTLEATALVLAGRRFRSRAGAGPGPRHAQGLEVGCAGAAYRTYAPGEPDQFQRRHRDSGQSQRRLRSRPCLSPQGKRS